MRILSTSAAGAGDRNQWTGRIHACRSEAIFFNLSDQAAGIAFGQFLPAGSYPSDFMAGDDPQTPVTGLNLPVIHLKSS
jgi:hypothetical protein